MSKVLTVCFDKFGEGGIPLREFPKKYSKSARRVSMKGKSIESEVLFQKLGNVWYAFSVVNDECIYSALPDGIDPRTTKLELIEVIDEHLKKVSEVESSSGTDGPLAAA